MLASSFGGSGVLAGRDSNDDPSRNWRPCDLEFPSGSGAARLFGRGRHDRMRGFGSRGPRRYHTRDRLEVWWVGTGGRQHDWVRGTQIPQTDVNTVAGIDRRRLGWNNQVHHRPRDWDRLLRP